MIAALLSWYDESPAWLTRCITSLTKLPISHLIAVDGAYAHYPDGQPTSPPEQADAIREAWGTDHLTLIRPRETWATEVAKRNRMFEIAETLPGITWYFVIDSDEFITQAPDNVHERLTRTPFDVAAVELTEPGHPLGTVIYPTHPKFFRAIPGLRAIQDHFTYTTPDGRRLWGDQKKHRMEARADLTDIKVEHHNQLRHPDRRNAALDYYRTRDALGIEDLPPDRTLLKEPA